MGLFRKKKEEEKVEETPVKEEVSDKKLELLIADVNKMKVQLESLNEVRRSTVERFGALTEQIGELRGQLMDTNKTIGTIEVKSTRAADLVQSVHPDKLMIEVQKVDGKIEAVKANIESNEAMMHNLMEQIKKMRSQVSAFRGIEQVLKMNQEVKDDILNIKKITATVERHSDKVESIFGDMQKTYREYNIFADTLKDIQKEQKNINQMLDSLSTKLTEQLPRKEFDKKYSDMEVFQKRLKHLIKDIENERKKYKRDFDYAKKEIQLKFEKEFAAAKLMSDAFERMLMKNPELAQDLHLKDYIKERVDELNSEEKIVNEEEKKE